MSIADDIANMTAKFTEEKTKEALSQMSLEEIAQVWQDIHSEHDAPAATDEEKSKKDKDYDERRTAIQGIMTPEKLQKQIEEYAELLSRGEFSPADFRKIAEFCNDFNADFKNDTIKYALGDLTKNMEEKRLGMENPITLTGKTLAEGLNIEEVDSIVIEGDKEKIDSLSDKKQIGGKSVAFKGAEDKELGKVSFDEKGMADITFTNDKNEPMHYQLTPEGKLTYLQEGQEPQEITSENAAAAPEHIQAVKLAGSAKKVWNDYSNGDLDASIEKDIEVNEAEGNEQTSTQINEGQEATRIDQAPHTADSGNTTAFNEQETPDRKDATLDGGTKDDIKPNVEDEVYWQEADIIQTMFKEWFLAAANKITNIIVHQIEYCCAGIWNELETAMAERKIQMEKDQKKAEKQDETQQFYGKVHNTSQQTMASLTEGYAGPKTDKRGNLKTDRDGNAIYGREATEQHNRLIEAINGGNIDEAIAGNRLLQNLAEFGIDPKRLLTQGEPEKMVPYTMGIALMLGKFADDYALASLLNKQMNEPNYCKENGTPNGKYAAKRQEAYNILKDQIVTYGREHPNADLTKTLADVFQTCCAEIKEAKEIAVNDFNNGQYVEKGKNPNPNPILARYEYLAENPNSARRNQEQERPNPEREQPTPKQELPTTLNDEANRQTQADSFIDFVKDGLNMEDATLTGREQNLQQRREAVARSKKFILEGMQVENSPLRLEEQAKLKQQNQEPQIRIPLRPQGRE